MDGDPRGALDLTRGRAPDFLPLTIRREMGRLLPELAMGDGEATAPLDYLKLFEGVALLLAGVAGRRPVVVVLEDLHWADEMSVRLLAFIARRLAPWHLLLLWTAREEELANVPLLPPMLAELDRESHVATIALGPLSRGETVDLVRVLARPVADQTAADRLSEEVWQTSEGNPFIVVEAVRAATQNALTPGLERLPMPDRVRDLVGRQLNRLDERTRELVALASVVGREFSFALLQHVAGRNEEETARAIEELTRRRVLHSVGEGLDFTHDRVREVAYHRIPRPAATGCTAGWLRRSRPFTRRTSSRTIWRSASITPREKSGTRLSFIFAEPASELPHGRPTERRRRASSARWPLYRTFRTAEIRANRPSRSASSYVTCWSSSVKSAGR